MKKIFVAGHAGMVGSAICRRLKTQRDVQLVTASRDELDLCNQSAVKEFIFSAKPDEIIVAAAKVGGIEANDAYPAEFIYQNLQIQNNLIHSAHQSDIQKLLFLGSSCIYPKLAEQPMKEDALLTGKLEPTNEPYAIAKIAGIKMCESYNRQYGRDYRSVMPTNLYGPGDNYHPVNSHVVPALINRFHHAKINCLSEVAIWGSGEVTRDFLFVDDMADASLLVHELSSEQYQAHTSSRLSHINVGTGVDISIGTLSRYIKGIVNFDGEIVFDKSKPDGTPKKLMDNTKIAKLGWRHSVEILDGLKISYEEFKKSHYS